MLENKEVMANNILSYMRKNNKTRYEVCQALGFKYSTFSEWVNGKKYPRIDKIEMMANYFGCEKSDLIEDKTKQPTQGEPSVRKQKFIDKILGMSDAELDRLEQILDLIAPKDE